MKKALLVFAALATLLFATTARADIITNGAFDTGTGGWIVTGAEWKNGAVDLAPNMFANASTLTQFFSIPAGTEKLTLSFDLNISLSQFSGIAAGAAFTAHFNCADLGINDTVLYSWATADAIWSWGGETLFSETLTFDLDFNRVLNLPVDNAMISFVFAMGGASLGFDVLIDNVTLGPASPAVPVPAAVWLLGSGLAGIVALRRKMN